MNEPFLPTPVPEPPEHGFGAVLLAVLRGLFRLLPAYPPRVRLRVPYLPPSRE